MTEDEARDMIIQQARNVADYWITLDSDISMESRVTGALFSFLCCLDGVGGEHTPCDIMVAELNEETGDKIGEVRVSTMLHEFLYRGWRSNVDADGNVIVLNRVKEAQIKGSDCTP